MVFKKGDTPWNKGVPQTKKFKEHLREVAKTNKNYGMKGKKHTKETKKILSSKAIGRKHTKEAKLKMSISKKGIPHSKEHNLKVSLALKGKKKSKEHILNVIKSKKYIKGKNYEEIYGLKKAEDIKEKLSKKQKLEKNANWRGGISFEPYDKNFNNKFKRAIRKRDNQVCMLCGIHREKLKKSLDIHHINYDKLLSIFPNCISLCHSCHMKTNFNRKHWIKFFQGLLFERYGYEYSKDKVIILNMEKKI